eukprot:508149-Amphidinium_carterae.1
MKQQTQRTIVQLQAQSITVTLLVPIVNGALDSFPCLMSSFVMSIKTKAGNLRVSDLPYLVTVCSGNRLEEMSKAIRALADLLYYR